MIPERHVKLFKNGRNQAVRIPREFELPGEDAIMRKEGDRLIIERAAPADVSYGRRRTRLGRAGTPIGSNDLLIAAQTLTLGYTIVTGNEAEFARIDELPQENWLRLP